MATFIETLRRLLSDPALSTKNTIFDASMKTYYTDRVDALTPDQVQWFGAGDVDTTDDVPTGALTPNVSKSAIQLDIDGFNIRTSRYRDGLQSTPRKIRRRTPGDILAATPADRVRYVLADPTDGVLLLDQNLEIVRTFPGLITAGAVVGPQYRQAECAAVATIGVNELMFVACGPQNVVKIFNYATGALVATIGTGVAGLPDDAPDALLTDPVSVTVDEANEILFIACRTGEATGGDASDTGFVCEFDISTPAAPAFLDYVVIGNGLFRLNNSQCTRPSDVFFQAAKVGPPAQNMRLWVANGLGDVAAFERAAPGDTWVPALVIEAQGDGFILGPDTLTVTSAFYAENALDVLTDSDGIGRLYVAASHTARVEVFRVSAASASVPLGTHESTYGDRGLENSMPYGMVLRAYSTPLEPKLTFGVFAQATGVVADETTLPGEATAAQVLLVADASAGRLQRLRLSVFEDENTVTFLPETSDIPVHIVGWFLPDNANFPVDSLTLEVRDPGDDTAVPVISAGDWREVPRAGFAVSTQGPTQTRYQFRLRATLPRTSPVKAYQTGAVGVLLRQEW